MYGAPNAQALWEMVEKDANADWEYRTFCATLAAFARGETRFVIEEWEKRYDGSSILVRDTVFITGRILSAELPDFYGAGALPVNYPNEWDVRLGRTGYGIWIHGVPSDTYSRVPRASDGCVAISNQDLAPLLDLLSPGQTPVVLVGGLDWIELEDLHQRRAELLSRIAHWREAWESLNMAQYGGFYSTDFRSESTDRDGWLAQ